MRPEAVEAMEPFLVAEFANPSGGHRAAGTAKTALEDARESLADLLGARPQEVVFTAGGTEADNLAVKGAARAARSGGRGDGVVTARFEHKAVLASSDRLEAEGFRVARVGADLSGLVDVDALVDALDDDTVVVSLMLVNNEVGTVQPLEGIVEQVRLHAPGAVVHTDAVQGAPWLDVAAATAAVELVAVSAHKFGGPKGIGALVVRTGTMLEPLVEGGGQERGVRSGTSNVAGAVAMAAALRATHASLVADRVRISHLRDRLADGLLATVSGSFENGDRARKIAGNAHLGFRGVESEALLMLLDTQGLYAAAGSSCSSGATEPSHVLAAMEIPRVDALSSVRFSLGFASTDRDVDVALRLVPAAVEQLRAGAVAA
jgi:cysteine desulfurase